MNSNMFFRSPRDWVKLVIEHLESALNVTIKSTYTRSQAELAEPRISYLVGEADPVLGYANDGRNSHDIELRFLIEVPTSIDDFDLEALDASTRLDRELSSRVVAFDDTDEAVVVSNLPNRFQPDHGVFSRVVTMRQKIRMGPVDEEYAELVGVNTNECNQAHSCVGE